MRRNYWSCGSFSAWVRNTFCKQVPKPNAATSEEWKEFRKQNKTHCPFIYWFTEDFLDRVQNVLYWPHDKLMDIKAYIVNRWIVKTHVLKSDLKPGQYHELDTLILHALFTEFIDFIEVEKAWMNIVFSEEQKKKHGYPTWRQGLFRWGQWRCPASGLEHLKWEMTLNSEELPEYDRSPSQAAYAKEELELYTWWKNRPNRPDPYEASGWNEIYEKGMGRDNFFDNLQNVPRNVQSATSAKLQDIEEAYAKEDEDMLIRLIKIRRGLWT